MPPSRERADIAFFACVSAIERLAAQRLERALPAGLSGAGFAVLNRLAISPDPASPLALAAALKLSKPAMTHTLQRLEGQGLVAVTADPDDGRRKRVALTPAGAAAQRAGAAAVRPRLDEVRAAFNPSEFEAVLPFLERLGAWLAAHP
ncbi:MAG TPA: MarR family transcriptional regulator [Caulobacteraceae bacterium]|jgi:DNA-binding MarR family transcriptional regulator